MKTPILLQQNVTKRKAEVGLRFKDKKHFIPLPCPTTLFTVSSTVAQLLIRTSRIKLIKSLHSIRSHDAQTIIVKFSGSHLINILHHLWENVEYRYVEYRYVFFRNCGHDSIHGFNI